MLACACLLAGRQPAVPTGVCYSNHWAGRHLLLPLSYYLKGWKYFWELSKQREVQTAQVPFSWICSTSCTRSPQWEHFWGLKRALGISPRYGHPRCAEAPRVPSLCLLQLPCCFLCFTCHSLPIFFFFQSAYSHRCSSLEILKNLRMSHSKKLFPGVSLSTALVGPEDGLLYRGQSDEEA